MSSPAFVGLFYLSGSYTQLHYNTSSYTIEYLILPNIWVEVDEFKFLLFLLLLLRIKTEGFDLI